MLIIGLTGGIATGKSTVSKLLTDRGYEVIDTDQIAHGLLVPESDLLQEVVETFGSTVLNPDNSLNRKALGDVIFSDEVARAKLDAIMHPNILEEVKRQLEQSSASLLFIDVPLLFEAGFDQLTHLNVVVYANPEEQLKRLMKRDNISVVNALAAHKKVDAQLPIDEKVRLADFVVDNNGLLTDLESNLDQVLEKVVGAVNHEAKC